MKRFIRWILRSISNFWGLDIQPLPTVKSIHVYPRAQNTHTFQPQRNTIRITQRQQPPTPETLPFGYTTPVNTSFPYTDRFEEQPSNKRIKVKPHIKPNSESGGISVTIQFPNGQSSEDTESLIKLLLKMAGGNNTRISLNN